MTRKTNESEALLKCPFCGGKAVLCDASESGRFLAFVTCDNDNCAVVTNGYEQAKDAIAAWNRRTPFIEYF